MSITDRINCAATVAIAVFAFIQILVLCQQRQEMTRQAKAMDETLCESQKATAATETAAKAAAKSADLAEKSLDISARPWIVFLPPVIPNVVARDNPDRTGLGVRVGAKNIGNSPAFMKKMGARILPAGKLPSRDEVVRLCYMDSNGAISPNEVIEFSSPEVLTKPIDSNGSVYLVMYALYEDIFENEHISMRTWQWDPAAREFVLIYAPDHNINT